MKVLKIYARTWETIGHVTYKNGDQLPAFVSMINGQLSTLRIGETAEHASSGKEGYCVTYNLYTEKDQQRLADSDIVEISFDVPTYVNINQWRKKRTETAPL